MIANVTVGIAVDDTIHYLLWFRRNVLKEIDMNDIVMSKVRYEF